MAAREQEPESRQPEQTRSIGDRLVFLGLDAQASDIFAQLRSGMSGILESSLTEFYNRLRAMPEMAHFFPTLEIMHTAQSLQQAHWETILTGRFGPDY